MQINNNGNVLSVEECFALLHIDEKSNDFIMDDSPFDYNGNYYYSFDFKWDSPNQVMNCGLVVIDNSFPQGETQWKKPS